MAPAMRERAESQRAVTLWTARTIPLVLTGVVGYATYVFVVRLCINYLLIDSSARPGGADRSAAVAFLTVYFILLLPMATVYIKLLYVVQMDPGYVPLGAGAHGGKARKQKDSPMLEKRAGPLASELRGSGNVPRNTNEDANSIGSREYTPYSSTDVDLEAAGGFAADSGEGSIHSEESQKALEEFWKKDVFVCMNDGRPKWCSDCAVWKTDRTHHCSDVGRCVKKMDHFCPWVGGVVAENSFKFFFQFVTLTWLYCLFITVILAIYVAEQKGSGSLDAQLAVILGIAAFFFLFTLGMSCSSFHFIITNLSTIENLNRGGTVMYLAIRIHDPNSILRIRQMKSTITYPLQADSYRNPFANRSAPPTTAPVDSNHTPLIHDSVDDGNAEANNMLAANNRDASIAPSIIASANDNITHPEQREFAIVQTNAGENPWDLGYYENWKTVMGSNFLEWILPIQRSPCTKHEDPESRFKVGKVVKDHRFRLGL